MVHSLYWVSALTYAFIVATLLINHLKDTREKGKEVGKAFRQLLVWVLYFCLQDVFWGMCGAGFFNDKAFYVSSTIFHCSTVLTTFFWLKYIFSYLGERVKLRKLYLWLDFCVIIFQDILLVINLFVPTIYTVEDGVYVTQFLRPFAFLNQYIVYFTIGAITFVCACREKGETRERFLTVFWFALAPILSGIFQLLYPDGPFYSMGYFLGCFIIHIFVVSKEREDAASVTTIKSVAGIYHSMHLIDIREDYVERLISNPLIDQYVNSTSGIRQMMKAVVEATVSRKYLEDMLDFTDLDKVAKNLSDQNIISFEFVGKTVGWTRASFILVERDSNGYAKKVVFTTQVIQAEKRRELALIYKSNIDELTGLFNRRLYEESLASAFGGVLEDKLVYISLDVNGLKVVNDNLGHEAGDELLKGAANCMKRVFGKYGSIYRMGGDEFVIVIEADDDKLSELTKDFNDMVDRWSGYEADSLSVSYGYTSFREFKDKSIEELARIADERMYEAKAAYYREKGVDRRGQSAAQNALCNLYAKILKVNLTKDIYYIVNMREEEKTKAIGFDDKISAWLTDFGRSGQVHADDLENYLRKTDINYLKEFFKTGNEHLGISYRRKLGSEYKNVIMEMIPADDYSENNQSLYLYVRENVM